MNACAEHAKKCSVCPPSGFPKLGHLSRKYPGGYRFSTRHSCSVPGNVTCSDKGCSGRNVSTLRHVPLTHDLEKSESEWMTKKRMSVGVLWTGLDWQESYSPWLSSATREAEEMNGKRSGLTQSQARTLFNYTDYNNEVTCLRWGRHGEQKWPAEDVVVSCFNVFSRISSGDTPAVTTATAPTVLPTECLWNTNQTRYLQNQPAQLAI